MPTGIARAAALCLAGSCMAGVVYGQGQGLVIMPTLAVTETWTDNVGLSRTSPRSDLVTEIRPGISITSRRGALIGSLSYAAEGKVYARESWRNGVNHNLNSTGGLRLWDGRLGVDASAAASQQTISAYGTQSNDSRLDHDNQTQVFSYSLSPYLRGRLLGNVNYEARAFHNASENDSQSIGNSRSVGASLGLNGGAGALGWSLDGNRLIASSNDRPNSHIGSVIGALAYTVDVELQFRVRAGFDVDDMMTAESQRTTAWGYGATWAPGPRTSVRFDLDRRYFGRSHSFAASHRMVRTVWTVSDMRNLQLGGSRGRAEISNYELYFILFASMEPDPVRREALVRSFLAANGLDAAERIVIGGFLTSGPTLQRRQNISMAYRGQRATFTVTAHRTRTTGAAAVSNDGDLEGGEIRQSGLSVSLSHRLTSDASIVVTASQQRTEGNGLRSGNELRSLVATWSTRLGPSSSASLGVRHSDHSGDVSSYQETAITGTVRMRF